MSGSTYTTALAGQASLSINGTPWNIQGELTWSPSGNVNETLKGQTAVEGFSTMPQQGYIQATLRDAPSQKVSALQGASGLTVIATLANGKVITAVNAWHVETITLNTQEGTFEVRFEAVEVTEDTV